MSKRVMVVITEDPTTTHRPVEALRIALGLSAGDHETTIVLLGRAPLLLTDDTEDVVDVDILEKYRPSLAQLGIPFIIETYTWPEQLRGRDRLVENICQELVWVREKLSLSRV